VGEEEEEEAAAASFLFLINWLAERCLT